MGFFFYIIVAIIAYIGYRVYRHPYDARADPSDPNYKTISESGEDSSVFEDKLAKSAGSLATARSCGSAKLARTPSTSASSETKSGKIRRRQR